MSRPPYIGENHWHELTVESCISPEIAIANFVTLDGDEVFDYLFYSPDIPRTNTGRVAQRYLTRYGQLSKTKGFWCKSVGSLWGQYKPDDPRIDSQKDKPVKYEQPPDVTGELYTQAIPVATWQLIAHRFDVTLPDNYREVKEKPEIFWQWVIDNPKIPIVITEGSKKSACILSCGYVAVALPGITMGIRRPKDAYGDIAGLPFLIPQLQIFAAAGRRIYFAFDQDSKRNTRRDVANAITKQAKLFKKFDCEPHVISWDRKLGKGIDDALFNSSKLGIEPEEQFSNFYRAALSFDDWESHQLKELTYPVDQKLNRRYLLNNDDPNDTLPPADAQLIGLKAPKSCGKTHWMSWFTHPFLQSGEKKILLITHRIQLSTQTADRLGIPYVTQIKDSEVGYSLGMGLCIDSLHPNSQAKFNPEYWKNSVVVIDEIMQVIWHLLSSPTCVKERVVIIKTFKQLLQNVIRAGGKIVIADADLNDIAIDFIKGLIGWEINTHIIENEFKFTQPWKVHNFKDKNPARLVALLKERLEKGEKHLVCVSGQKAKSKWGSTCLEAYFKKHLPELKILRVDSETVANPKHPAFNCTSNINEVIKDYDLVIATPTIETGVSIEEKHFQGVWGIFQGVSTTDSVRQFLSRYRVPVPRYIWLKSTGIGFIGNKSTNFKALIASQKKLDKANRNRLIDCGFEETLDGSFEPIALTTWAKLGAIINRGKWAYSEQVLNDLREEGHIIVDVEGDDTVIFVDDEIKLPDGSQVEKTKTQIDDNRDEQYLKHRENVAEAESLIDSQYDKLQLQQTRNDEELLQLKKARLERNYHVEVTPSLVLKDDEGWYSQIRLHYYFTCGRKFLPSKDNQSMRGLMVENDYFVVDSNKKLLGKAIDALDFLGISRLYEEDKLHQNHSVIMDIFDKCKKNMYSLKMALGIDLSKVNKPIQCVQNVLALIGHKMPFVKREGSKGNQVRVYGKPAADFVKEEIPGAKKPQIKLENGSPVIKPDGREEVYAKWIERDTKIEEEIAEAKRKHDKWCNEEQLAAIAEDLQVAVDKNALDDILVIYPYLPAIFAALKRLPADTQAIINKFYGWVAA
jgi:hypothetical protein